MVGRYKGEIWGDARVEERSVQKASTESSHSLLYVHDLGFAVPCLWELTEPPFIDEIAKNPVPCGVIGPGIKEKREWLQRVQEHGYQPVKHHAHANLRATSC